MKNILSTLLTARPEQVKVEVKWKEWYAVITSLSFTLLLLEIASPTTLSFSFWELWITKGSVTEWLIASWPTLTWAMGMTFLTSALTRNYGSENYHVESQLKLGIWLSLLVGFLEEISFRWIAFLFCILMAKLGDYILGGFLLDHGLVWLLYSFILSPIADFFTFGLLHGQLSDTDTWFIAAALLMANSQFRDGHKYQGLLGLVNSWFIGMYMFYLLFTYGLVAAIVVHLVYDICIFVIEYLDRAHERSRY